VRGSNPSCGARDLADSQPLVKILFPELGFFWIFLSNLIILRQFPQKSHSIDGRISILPRSRKKTIASKRILRHSSPVSTLLHHSESGKAHSHHGIAIQAR
jgi:hypothetical protein